MYRRRKNALDAQTYEEYLEKSELEFEKSMMQLKSKEQRNSQLIAYKDPFLPLLQQNTQTVVFLTLNVLETFFWILNKACLHSQILQQEAIQERGKTVFLVFQLQRQKDNCLINFVIQDLGFDNDQILRIYHQNCDELHIQENMDNQTKIKIDSVLKILDFKNLKQYYFQL